MSMFAVLAPAGLVTIGGLVCLGSEPFLRTEAKHKVLPIAAILSLLAALVSVGILGYVGYADHIAGLFCMEPIRAWLIGAIVVAGGISLAGLAQALQRDNFPGGEPYALSLFAIAGAILMVQASDALALFIGLEIASLAIYALVGLRRHRPEANEGLFKYFVMGALFSAIFIYGGALVYGATGSTHFGAEVLPGRESLWLLGHGLMIIGLLFKVGAVPFHFWSPDAYTGAPVAVTGLMGAIIKIGGFVALGALWLGMVNSAGSSTVYTGPISLAQRVVIDAQASKLLAPCVLVFMMLGLIAIGLGNISAYHQRSVRRLVAYSAIAHTGFMLFALVLPMIGATFSLTGLWIYLVAYGIATAVTLTGVSSLSSNEDADDSLQGLAGQGRMNPLTGLCLTVSVAATAGLPPTLGFLGKFAVVSWLVSAGYWYFALAAMLLAVIGAAYYVRFIVSLWYDTPRTNRIAQHGALSICLMCLGSLALVALFAVPHWIVPQS